MKHWLKHGNHVGFFLVFIFIICFIGYWIHPVNQPLHQQLLELTFFAYEGMGFGSFISGLIQSYIWGYIGVALWMLACCGKGCCHERKE